MGAKQQTVNIFRADLFDTILPKKLSGLNPFTKKAYKRIPKKNINGVSKKNPIKIKILMPMAVYFCEPLAIAARTAVCGETTGGISSTLMY